MVWLCILMLIQQFDVTCFFKFSIEESSCNGRGSRCLCRHPELINGVAKADWVCTFSLLFSGLVVQSSN